MRFHIQHFPNFFAGLPSTGRIIRLLSWALLCALILFRFGAVIRHAVDIPLLDEWEMIPFIAENAQEFDWRSFFRFHNDHRILFTRLEVYTAYLINGWNIPCALGVNYMLYLAMVGMLIAICNPALRWFPAYPLLFVPFFSDFVWINMAWAFQSQFHFMILFGLGAIWFGLVRPATVGNTAMFVAFCGLSMFSMSPAYALGIWLVYAMGRIGQTTPANEPRPWALASGATIAIGALTLAFLKGFSGIHLEGQPGFSLLYPWDGQFWSYVFKTLANAFGARLYDIAPWLAFGVGPAMGSILGLTLFARRPWDSRLLAPLAVVSASMVSLAAIAYGRGCMEQMACDRHMEVVLGTFPALWAIWAILPRRRIAIAGLWAACAITLAGYAAYLWPREAPKMRDYLVAGQWEIIDFAQGEKTQVDSETLYPADMTGHVLLARKLNLSFTREIPGAIWDQAGDFSAGAASRNRGAAADQNPP